MLEELGKEFSALQERGEKIRPILQDMMKKHTEAGTAYKNDPAFIELFEENSRITTRLREIPQLANRVFFGKVKTIA
jgi:hypothetical protein